MPSKISADNPWRVDWNVSGSVVRRNFSASALEQIERVVASALGKGRLSSNDKETLFQTVFSETELFFIERPNAFGRPALRDVKKRLKAIREASVDLHNAFAAADDLSLYFLLREMTGDKGSTDVHQPYAVDITDTIEKHYEILQNRLEGVLALEKYSRDALTSLPRISKPGTKPDWAVHRYIRRMTNTYKIWTHIRKVTVPFNWETERYYGPLFDFIEACFRPIDPAPDRSNQALGELIRRALGFRSTPPR